MRILLVSQYFWPENFRINDLALALQEQGHEITVLTAHPNYPGGRFFPGYGLFTKHTEYYHGICIIRSPIIPRGDGGGLRLALNYLSFVLAASLTVLLRCRGDYDRIFVAQYSPVTVALPAILAKKQKKIPLLMWIQDLWPESISATGAIKTPSIIALVDKLVRYIYRQCDTILVQSEGFIGQVIAHGFALDRIKYLPNWAEELYQPVTQSADPPDDVIFPAGFRIMFAGNIGAAQDFDTILAAAEMLKDHQDVHWLVIGDGRARDTVAEAISAKGLAANFHLLGRYPMECMPEFFSQADVMLVTLKAEPIFALTIPGKVQSYLACAKPILAALDGEGARVISAAGAGLVGPAEDAAALAANALAFYRQTVPERQAMGLRGRKYYEENFARNRLLKRLNQWLAGQ